MARTVNEIHESLIEAKASNSDLDGLTSTSSVSIWRQVLYVVAVATAVLEQMWDLFTQEIDAAIDSKPNQTDLWLQNEALKFQDGYNIEVDEFYKPFYSVIDADANIITISSARTISYGVCLLKVAKGEQGAYTALSESELIRFGDYVSDIKPLGTRIQIISQESDKLKGVFSVFYDPSFDSVEIASNVSNAIEAFLTLLPFNGLFYVSRLVDAIQAVDGVVDVDVSDLKAKTNTGQYASFGRKYLPFSGYLTIDDLGTTFNYEAE